MKRILGVGISLLLIVIVLVSWISQPEKRECVLFEKGIQEDATPASGSRCGPQQEEYEHSFSSLLRWNAW